jgi:predicted nucleic acid-binding protein
MELRGSGVTVPLMDVLIAAVAISSGAVLVHRDRHFDLIAEHAPLHVESYVAA